MNPKPNGRIRGTDLVLTRAFRAPIDDVWTSVTHPDSTARWFGRWEGQGGAGQDIRVQMGFEKGAPWMDAHIEACEAPRNFLVTTKMGWRMELTLTQSGDTTTLEFVHHQINPKEVGEVGPGWEYYLDNLVAARANEPLPTFEMYYPSQKDYYLAQAPK